MKRFKKYTAALLLAVLLTAAFTAHADAVPTLSDAKRSGTKVTFTVRNAEDGQCAAVAAYDADGRMAEVRILPLSPERTSYEAVFSQSVTKGKVMLLDAGFRPLCPAADAEAGSGVVLPIIPMALLMEEAP